MAKFNIEVELDWMDEEAYSIDDELRVTWRPLTHWIASTS